MILARPKAEDDLIAEIQAISGVDVRACYQCGKCTAGCPTEQLNSPETIQPEVTIEDVKRVLEVGKILMSALTPEELDQLREVMSNQALDHLLVMSLSSRSDVGDTSVT